MPTAPQALLAAQPSTRSRASVARSHTRAAPKVPYPELPVVPSMSGGRVTNAEFDRVAFLRRLAEHRAAEALVKALHQRADTQSLRQTQTRLFMYGALDHSVDGLRRRFEDWMQSSGGMAGTGEVLQ